MTSKKESTEDYLEKILMLKGRLKLVRSVDIANFMNYTKASVSIAIKKLIKERYVTINRQNGEVNLTCEGQKIAENIYDRHVVISKCLESLNISKNIAEQDACKIEHDLSDESYNIIKANYYKKIKTKN